MQILTRAARRLEQFPDTPAWFDRNLAAPGRQAIVLLIIGLALRIATFGDPNLHVDEAWYFLVGQEMHHGAIPYVTIWDRKPVGLFLLYYLFAGISTNVLAYQIPAWLFASATAWVIARIAARWTNAQGAVLAGAAYLLMLGPLEGFGGQTPVFYNLLIAGAAWLVLQSIEDVDAGRPGWRMIAAMALAGTALTFKQTTMFEGAFFGLFAAWRLWRSDAKRTLVAGWVLLWLALGMAPTALTAAWYAWNGFWDEYWQAMVGSNLTKVKPTIEIVAASALRVVLRLYPLVALTWLGFTASKLEKPLGKENVLYLGWTISAACGVLIIPNFYLHYALPILVPLAASSSLAFGRRDIGLFVGLCVIGFCCFLQRPFDFDHSRQSINSMTALSHYVETSDKAGGLVIYDGPPLLYLLTNNHPTTPLAFPHHLNHAIEKDVSQYSTRDEVRRIITMRPRVIVMAAFPSNIPENRETRDLIEDYAYSSCRFLGSDLSIEIGHSEQIAVFGSCKSDKADRWIK